MNFGPYSFDVSHPDKVLFPQTGLSKQGLIDYYVEVAGYLLPHTKDRPLAMHRFPDGIEGKDFFQKNVPDYFPDWIQRVKVEREGDGSLQMVLANNQATLAYLANQACIVPHIWLSRAKNLRHPDKMIFDLDPPPGKFEWVIEAARMLRTVLEEQELSAFVMTTGSEGLHVVVPLKPEREFDAVRDHARKICESIADKEPDRFTTEVRKNKRKGRVFLDFLRNAYGQHGIAPYGVRALPKAPVAKPLDWEELEDLEDGARTWRVENVLERLGDRGDPWKGMMRHAATL